VSKVPAKPIKPPKALEKLFNCPPLVGNEKVEDYDAVFFAIAAVVNPTDIILWLLTREYADISWEHQRERRIKAEIIKLKQREAKGSSGLGINLADFERKKLGIESPSAFQKRDAKPEIMEDESSYLSEGFMSGHFDIDIIDTRIASYLFRRSAVLKDIQHSSDVKARKGKAPPDIIDGEFTEDPE
jgi:hypothetical protein